MTMRFLIILLFIVGAVKSEAHPHLFIEPSLKLLVTDQKITGLRVNWLWDKWWTEDVMAQCDLDKNGHLDSSEIKKVYKDFFIGIKSFNFFTEVEVNKKTIKYSDIKNFNARLNTENLLEYEFEIPLNQPLEVKANIRVRFSDQTIYTAFSAEIPVSGNKVIIEAVKSDSYGFYGAQVDFTAYLTE
jgi:ABC-type uncharacterized transport system substrate-binding protein